MAQILRSRCAAYVKQYAERGACFQVQSVLAKLSLCRTRALGGRKYQCDDCSEVTEVFHSCGDRHCPQCSGCKRYDFAERAEQLILPDVIYYQTVLTLPGNLSELALANREVMADLLFMSSAKSLRKTVRKFAYLQDEQAWEAFCDELSALDWVCFIQPPPTANCSTDQVVRYLARYLTGGPISDSRIIAADADQVTFLAREGTRVGGERRQVPVTLSTMEFVRRWCDHIQPDQLTKTRYFGGWCSRSRTQYQARCRRLLGTSPEPQADPAETSPSATVSLAEESSGERSCPQCHACQSRSLRLIGETAKPSWSIVLTHLDSRCPAWYAEKEYEAHCDRLEREYGISYDDWYLEMRIESTMSSPAASVAEQRYFPGLYPELNFAIESS